MHAAQLRAARLDAHLLTTPASSIVEAARHMAATQAQELWGGRFALAVRTRDAPTAADVDREFDAGTIVRTWPLRGTLHILAADDVAWMLSVATDRVLASLRSRHRQLGIDDADLRTAERTARRVLAEGGLARREMFAAFEADGQSTAGQRGAHLLLVLALRGVAHWGAVVPRPGRDSAEQLFTLNDVLPAQREIRGSATAELLRRYLVGHGPASIADFVWWSGVALTAARTAAVEAGREPDEHGLLAADDFDDTAVARSSPRLLPTFDEYYLSYADRRVACDPERATLIGPGRNGMVKAAIIRDGTVVGTWTRAGAVTAFDDVPLPENLLATWQAHSAAR